jgi:hypothetical protein
MVNICIPTGPLYVSNIRFRDLVPFGVCHLAKKMVLANSFFRHPDRLKNVHIIRIIRSNSVASAD